MPRLRRQLTVVAASSALLVGPLATLAPSTAAAPHAGTSAGESTSAADQAARANRVRKCVGGRPHGDFQYLTIRHKFPLPARGGWRKNYEMDRWCLFSNPRAKLRIGWAKGTGSLKAMKKRVERARATHRRFHLIRLHRLGSPFDDHTNRTAVAEFTFRNANGRRQHVRAVGDKYTVLVIRSSQRAWKHGVAKTANRAHRKMNRMILIAA